MSDELKALRNSTFFDSEFYLKKNPDVKLTGLDPSTHYLDYGGFEGRNPGPLFSTNAYLAANPDVAGAHFNALAHYEIYGRQEGRKLALGIKDLALNDPVTSQRWEVFFEKCSRIYRQRYSELLCTLGRLLQNKRLARRGQQYWNNMAPRTRAFKRRALSESKIFAVAQDLTFPKELACAEKIIAIVVPEHDAMSGGIYSFFSIAQQLRRLKRHHGHEVVLLTRPNPQKLTYFRNTNFRNSENVYRFEQILLCRLAKEVYLHIPEYTIDTFANDISAEERQYLLTRDKLHINVLNQNIRLMPPREHFADLREICGSMSQSVAHHAYFSQAIADKYALPTLLLPAFTDLSAYPPANFDEKEKLIIYSPDFAPHKAKCLDLITRSLPDFRLLEIRDITFDQFMEFATKCMFSLSFGEGFDGYLAQPIHQGGVGFTVYNEAFFPSDHFKYYFNIFKDEDEMQREIVIRISYLAKNRFEYQKLNKEFVQEFHKLYSFDVYVEQLRKLALKEFEFFPQ